MVVRSIVLVVLGLTTAACSGANSDPITDEIPVAKSGTVIAPAPAPAPAAATEAPRPGTDTGPAPAPGPTPIPVPTSLKSCCRMEGAFRAKCAPKASVSPKLLSMLANDDDDTCNDETEVCTPTENLDPKYEPATCKADPLLGPSYTGVCLSNCFVFGIAWIQMDQGDCGNVQTCVPCVRDGKATGAPGCPNAI